jgi:CheY-like chemotaxis protein
MPRLLLVDDNPSIHRIAESLLAPTDVDLVCVDSAAEALDRFGRGEHFDVALVDTAMPGMDGWTLLARLREMEATAHLPIALMAGVLDPVDPTRLAQAPIQGFLKKPIELRELGDRVRALLASAPPAPEPLAAPAVFEIPAPPAAPPVFAFPPPAPELEAPRTFEAPFAPLDLAPPPAPAALEDDLLVLTAEDVWPEEAPEAVAAPAETQVPGLPPLATAEVHLELEELDLEGLQDLAPQAPAALPTAIPAANPALDLLPPAPLDVPPAYTLTHELPPLPPPAAEALAEESLSFSGLESLDELGGALELPPLPEPPAAAEGHPVLPAALPAAFAEPLEAAHATPPPVIAPAISIPEPIAPAPVPPEPIPMAAAIPAVLGQPPAAPGQAAEMDPAQIQALLADPQLMDALVKAVVARMGDQVVREIAWEIMPELAGKLQK